MTLIKIMTAMTLLISMLEFKETDNTLWPYNQNASKQKPGADAENNELKEGRLVTKFELLDERFDYIFEKIQDDFVIAAQIFKERYKLDSNKDFLTIENSKSLNKLFPKQKLSQVGSEIEISDPIYFKTLTNQTITPGKLYFGKGYIVYPIIKDDVICYNYYSIFGGKNVYTASKDQSEIGQMVGDVLSINCTLNKNDIMFFDFEIAKPLIASTISVIFKGIITALEESYVDNTKPFTLVLPGYKLFSSNIISMEIYALWHTSTFKNQWNLINRVILFGLFMIAFFQNKAAIITLFVYMLFKFLKTEL